MIVEPHDESLRIVGLREGGAVLRHNREEKQCIGVGDVIHAVNGRTGTAATLVEEIRNSDEKIHVSVKKAQAAQAKEYFINE